MRTDSFEQADLIYQYDGTFEGFLSCVFTSFLKKEIPFAIWDAAQAALSLYPVVAIPTNTQHATRVFRGIGQKIAPRAQSILTTCFLADNSEKERTLLLFLCLGFQHGSATLAMLADPTVAAVMAMHKNILHEAHQYKGFLRFEEHENMLGAVIAPRHSILPLLRGHFCSRFPEESFLIYDETHHYVLLYQNHQAELIALSAPLQFPKPDEKESNYQALWKQFYQTIAIKERDNKLCRQTHCPKRYWAHMSELKDEL